MERYFWGALEAETSSKCIDFIQKQQNDKTRGVQQNAVTAETLETTEETITIFDDVVNNGDVILAAEDHGETTGDTIELSEEGDEVIAVAEGEIEEDSDPSDAQIV